VELAAPAAVKTKRVDPSFGVNPFYFWYARLDSNQRLPAPEAENYSFHCFPSFFTNQHNFF